MIRALRFLLIATAVLLLALAAAPDVQAQEGDLPAAQAYSDGPIDIIDVITRWCEYNSDSEAPHDGA